jgi:fatty-acyl-CoA synthase
MQLSYVSGTSSRPLLGETIGACLDRIAAAHPDAEALVSCHQSLRYTYAELRTEVERIARGLLALGVERGDRVGIWSPNCAEWAIVQYAAAKAGAILVNINPAYRLRELEYALRQSGVSILILARRFRNTDYVELLTELAPELRTAASTRLAVERLPSLRAVVYLGADAAPGGVSWAGLAARGDAVAPSHLHERESGLQFDDAANVQYTSGTTGARRKARRFHTTTS